MPENIVFLHDEDVITIEQAERMYEVAKIPIDISRCHKCVYEMQCSRDRDNEGKCPRYKRDASDGGYYG